MTVESILFWVFALMACGSAVAVVATQNVVRMALWLVMSLGSVAALFFLLHADFLGGVQLLIYVGGTVVLLVFGVMLTASGPFSRIETSPAEGILGASVGLLLLFTLWFSIGSVDWDQLSRRLPLSPASKDRAAIAQAGSQNPSKGDAEVQSIETGNTNATLGLGFLGVRADRDLAKPAGSRLSPGYLLPFEIISVHLLVVLIGAAYLARAKRRVVVEESRPQA